MYVGYRGPGSKLIVSDGGTLLSTNTYLGYNSSSSNNSVLVTGTNSLWRVPFIYVGGSGGSNALTVGDSGTVRTTNVGIGTVSSGTNLVTVAGGNLYVTNAAGTAQLTVRRGTFAMTGGTTVVDRFIATNTTGLLDFDGGTLTAKNMNVSNGSVFAIGNGVDAATLNLRGTGHRFANGLSISSNATVNGIGSFTGAVTFLDGAHMAPGSSPGTLTNYGDVLFSSLSLLDYELGPPGVVGGGTNDLFVINGNLTLDGILNVTPLSGFGTGTYTLITYSGSLVNNGLSVSPLPLGLGGSIQAGGGTVRLVVVPEPSAAALLCAGLSAWFLARRRTPHRP
jgi:fibronectin-binding autotransporter adhesin